MRNELVLENMEYIENSIDENYNFYDREYLEESVEDDSISQEEEAFMRGYLEDF